MPFESLTRTLDGFFSKIRGKARLTEDNIREGLREVRLALLEADVNYLVVKDFIQRVTDRAIGEALIKGVNPAQQIVKIVHDELVGLMGPVDHVLPFKKDGVTVFMLAGLQGSGKTTTCAKLALLLRKQGRRPLMVAADVQRPAAIDQLETLGKQCEIPVFSDRQMPATTICHGSLMFAENNECDTVLLDTAGRLHIDEDMMAELRTIGRGVKPDQILLVCDAMTGQDAVVSAREFNDQLELDGVILTKLDGDARGGAALSIKAVTGKPIKFVGMGEKLDTLEPFYPDRMASRILGMGDIVSFVEKAQEVAEQEDTEKLAEKIKRATFDLEDFRKQIRMMRRMGPLRDLMSYLPGLGGLNMSDMDVDEKEVDHIEAIINSMTPQERQWPEVISAGRRVRIAKGSGMDPTDVSKLIKQFMQVRKMMKKVSSGNMDALRDVLPPELAAGAGAMPAPAAAQARRDRARSERKRRRKRRKKK